MGDPRDSLERLWDEQQTDDRHAAERLAEEIERLHDLRHNPRAIAVGEGIDTTDIDVARIAFNEVFELRSEVADLIQSCAALDPDVRSELAWAVRRADLHGGDMAAPFVELINRFRAEVVRRHPSARVLHQAITRGQSAELIRSWVLFARDLPDDARRRLIALINRGDHAGFVLALADAALAGEPELERIDHGLRRLIERADAATLR